MTVMDYITVDQLKTALQIKNDSNDDLLATAITAASRRIDEHCRDQFWSADTPSARVLAPDYPGDIWTGAYASTVGMTVETDEDNDGVFETLWGALDWQAEPLVPQAGAPFNRVVAVGNRFFPGSRKHPYLAFPYNGYGYGYAGGPGQTLYGQSRRARVRITARWGWPAVPAQVMQACQILAIDYYKSKDFTNGSAGTTGLSTGVFGGQKGIQLHSGINPLACSLLRGLRDVVVA
ncbi:MAG: phage gp6-like head-tail connector protein [Nocardioides sp.]|nr:phage gp6-like head-tail connector protein [Nocardioides sp.]